MDPLELPRPIPEPRILREEPFPPPAAPWEGGWRPGIKLSQPPTGSGSWEPDFKETGACPSWGWFLWNNLWILRRWIPLEKPFLKSGGSALGAASWLGRKQWRIQGKSRECAEFSSLWAVLESCRSRSKPWDHPMGMGSVGVGTSCHSRGFPFVFPLEAGNTRSKEPRARHIPGKPGSGEVGGSCSLGKLPAFPGLEFTGTAGKNQGCGAREEFSGIFQRFSFPILCWQLFLFPLKSWKSRNSDKIPAGFTWEQLLALDGPGVSSWNSRGFS